MERAYLEDPAFRIEHSVRALPGVDERQPLLAAAQLAALRALLTNPDRPATKSSS